MMLRVACDGTFQLQVLGLANDTHAALTELLSDLVVRDGLIDHNGPILPLCGLVLGNNRCHEL